MSSGCSPQVAALGQPQAPEHTPASHSHCTSSLCSLPWVGQCSLQMCPTGQVCPGQVPCVEQCKDKAGPCGKCCQRSAQRPVSSTQAPAAQAAQLPAHTHQLPPPLPWRKLDPERKEKQPPPHPCTEMQGASSSSQLPHCPSCPQPQQLWLPSSSPKRLK